MILPNLSNEVLLTKVAQRGACLSLASKIKADEIVKQQSNYTKTYLASPEIGTLLSDPQMSDIKGISEQIIVKMISDNFVPSLSPEIVTKCQNLINLADSILPPHIKSRKWSPDTCQCKIHQIIDTSDINNPTRTFHAHIGDEHTGRTVEELDEIITEENNRKNKFQTLTGLETEQYKWAFDKDRNLVVDVSTLPLEAKTNLIELAKRVEFKGKIKVNG